MLRFAAWLFPANPDACGVAGSPRAALATTVVANKP
jgi:hypothetical protein